MRGFSWTATHRHRHRYAVSTVVITNSPEFTSDNETITVTDANGTTTDANGFLEGIGLTHVGVGTYV